MSITDIAPQSNWYNSVNPTVVPHVHYYNFLTDMQATFQYHIALWTYTSDPVHFGDLVVKPGTDNPNDQSNDGGAGFLPYGSATDQHEYILNYGYLADGVYGDFTLLNAMAANTANHVHFGDNLQTLHVDACNGRVPNISISDEIVRILANPGSACA